MDPDTLDDVFYAQIFQILVREAAPAARQLGESAEGLVQDAFLRALRGGLNPAASSENQAFTYCRQALTWTIGDRRRRKGLPTAGEDELDPLPWGDPPDALALAEEMDLLRGALFVLSDEDRGLLEARLAGKTYQEIAARQGASLWALVRRFHRLIENLRRHLRAEQGQSLPRTDTGDDTQSGRASDTTIVPPIQTRGPASMGQPHRPTLDYEDLLAYARRRADAATKERIERSIPRAQLEAHLDSIRYFDLEQLAAAQDGEALERFGPDRHTPFCRRVAATAGEVLVRLSEDDDAPLEGVSRERWESHALACPYCRRLQRLAHARLTAQTAGIDKDQPLLRDWLLARHYRAALDRVTAELGGERLPYPTAAAPAPQPRSAAQPAVTGRHPDRLTELAEAVRRGEAERSALTTALAPSVRAYVGRAAAEPERAALVERCLTQIEQTLPQWDPAQRSISGWALEVCRHCCGRQE